MTSEVGSFSPRTVRFRRPLPAQLLAFNFTDDDKIRMRRLAQKNGEGELSSVEREDLHTYILAADVLSLLHAKAKRSLTRK